MPLKALFGKKGQTPRVVDVGVGDDDVVNEGGGEGEIAVVLFIPALLKAAVDEDVPAAGGDAVAGAGDGMGGAVETELHGIAPFSDIQNL